MNAQAKTIEAEQDVRFFDVKATQLLKLLSESKITREQADAGRDAYEILARSMPHLGIGDMNPDNRGPRSTPDGWTDSRLDRLGSDRKVRSVLMRLHQKANEAFWNVVIYELSLSDAAAKMFGTRNGRINKQALEYLHQALDDLGKEFGYIR